MLFWIRRRKSESKCCEGKSKHFSNVWPVPNSRKMNRVRLIALNERLPSITKRFRHSRNLDPQVWQKEFSGSLGGPLFLCPPVSIEWANLEQAARERRIGDRSQNGIRLATRISWQAASSAPSSLSRSLLSLGPTQPHPWLAPSGWGPLRIYDSGSGARLGSVGCELDSTNGSSSTTWRE